MSPGSYLLGEQRTLSLWGTREQKTPKYIHVGVLLV